MPTCGDCSLLIRNNAGIYICAGKQTLCFMEKLTPETDAKTCMRFYRKAPEKTEQSKPASA